MEPLTLALKPLVRCLVWDALCSHYGHLLSDSPDNALFDAALARGNELLKAKDLNGALAAYTEAIELDGSDAAFRSNRSAVYMSMKDFEKALVDAEVL